MEAFLITESCAKRGFFYFCDLARKIEMCFWQFLHKFHIIAQSKWRIYESINRRGIA